MTIQQLEYIIAVDRFKHFVNAANHCNVTQPTLSAMIQKLEEELSVKIFDRSTQPVSTTNIGKKIVEEAQIIVSKISNIKKIIDEEKNCMTGEVNIGVLPTIAPYLLPRFFQSFRNDYPQLNVRVSELHTSEIIRAIQSEEIDLGIIATKEEEKNIEYKSLYFEEFLGYVSQNEKLYKKEIIRSSEVNGKKLWLLDEGHCFRAQMLKFCSMQNVIKNQMTYSLGSLETFMRMVESGDGMTFIPAMSLSQLSDEQKKFVRPFAIPKPTREIVLCFKKDYVRHSIINILSEYIKAHVPSEMLKISPLQKIV